MPHAEFIPPFVGMAGDWVFGRSLPVACSEEPGSQVVGKSTLPQICCVGTQGGKGISEYLTPSTKIRGGGGRCPAPVGWL